MELTPGIRSLRGGVFSRFTLKLKNWAHKKNKKKAGRKNSAQKKPAQKNPSTVWISILKSANLVACLQIRCREAARAGVVALSPH